MKKEFTIKFEVILDISFIKSHRWDKKNSPDIRGLSFLHVRYDGIPSLLTNNDRTYSTLCFFIWQPLLTKKTSFNSLLLDYSILDTWLYMNMCFLQSHRWDCMHNAILKNIYYYFWYSLYLKNPSLLINNDQLFEFMGFSLCLTYLKRNIYDKLQQ